LNRHQRSDFGGLRSRLGSNLSENGCKGRHIF
jgi:hypothetical protein